MAVNDRAIDRRGTEDGPSVSIVHGARLAAESLAVCMRSALQSSSEVIVHVGHGTATWQQASGTVVVLDGSAEKASLIPAAVKTLSHRGSSVVLVVRDGADQVADAARFAGASAIFVDREPASRLIALVDSCLDGGRPRSTLLGGVGRGVASVVVDTLTAREAAVVELLLSDEEPSLGVVAERLGISVNTVRVHIANVRRRLGGASAKNRVSLRRALEERGWIDAQ